MSDMLDYARVSANMPESAWVAFVLYVPIVIPCLLEYVFTYFNRVYSLKEHEAVFFKRQNLIFYIVAGSISFASWF